MAGDEPVAEERVVGDEARRLFDRCGGEGDQPSRPVRKGSPEVVTQGKYSACVGAVARTRSGSRLMK
jgi:hypothetical protein